MLSHPAWLLTLAYIMCVIQLLVGEQVVEFVMFSSWEARFVRRFHRFKWLGREVTDAEGRTIRVPSRWTMLLIRCAEWEHAYARRRMRCCAGQRAQKWLCSPGEHVLPPLTSCHLTNCALLTGTSLCRVPYVSGRCQTCAAPAEHCWHAAV